MVNIYTIHIHIQPELFYIVYCILWFMMDPVDRCFMLCWKIHAQYFLVSPIFFGDSLLFCGMRIITLKMDGIWYGHTQCYLLFSYFISNDFFFLFFLHSNRSNIVGNRCILEHLIKNLCMMSTTKAIVEAYMFHWIWITKTEILIRSQNDRNRRVNKSI